MSDLEQEFEDISPFLEKKKYDDDFCLEQYETEWNDEEEIEESD